MEVCISDSHTIISHVKYEVLIQADEIKKTCFKQEFVSIKYPESKMDDKNIYNLLSLRKKGFLKHETRINLNMKYDVKIVSTCKTKLPHVWL